MKTTNNSGNDLLRWINLSPVHEKRGKLTEVDFHDLPFTPVRTFFISEVPAGTVRGGHAHRWGKQLLVCLSGRIKVLLRQDDREQSAICEANNRALLLEAGVWSQQTYLDAGSSLLVFCSHPFSCDSYVSGAVSESKWKQT